MAANFEYAKFELALKLAINRANIHKSKKIENSSKIKKEIAKLLETGKDALARVKVNDRSCVCELIIFFNRADCCTTARFVVHRQHQSFSRITK
jgi:hypothetical protein